MNIEELTNGYFKLTAENGVLDTRNDFLYSEVITKEKNIKFFKAA